MKITGVARSYDVTVPSAIGSLFGNTVINFMLSTDESVALPSGSTKLVPIRIDTFKRTPNLDGLKIEIEGDFDAFDEVVRARTARIAECNFHIAGVRRMGPLLALVVAMVTLCLNLFGWIIVGALLSLSNSPTGVFSGIVLFFAFVPFFWLSVKLLSMTVLPSINESIERGLRTWAEHST